MLPVATGTGTVEDPFTGLCVTAASDGIGNGTPAEVWRCLPGTSSQQWTGYSDGTLRINGKCLTVAGASAKVEIWACTGGANQKWQISQVSFNNFGPITNTGSGKALTDQGSTTNGTQLLSELA